MNEIQQLSDLIYNDVEFQSRFNISNEASLMAGIVQSVNEKDRYADVYIPSMSSVISKVRIGYGISSPANHIHCLPSKGDNVLIIYSNQCKPTIICVWGGDSYKNITTNEIEIASKHNAIKVSADNTFVKNDTSNILLSRGEANISSIKNNLSTISGTQKIDVTPDKDTYYELLINSSKSKIFYKDISEIVTDNDVNDIMLCHSQQLLKLRELLDDTVKFSNIDSVYGDEFNSSSNEFKNKLQTYYMNDLEDTELSTVKVEAGKINNSNDVYKVSFDKNNESVSSLIFKKDGTIELNCRDLTINKGGV